MGTNNRASSIHIVLPDALSRNVELHLMDDEGMPVETYRYVWMRHVDVERLGLLMARTIIKVLAQRPRPF